MPHRQGGNQEADEGPHSSNCMSGRLKICLLTKFTSQGSPWSCFLPLFLAQKERAAHRVGLEGWKPRAEREPLDSRRMWGCRQIPSHPLPSGAPLPDGQRDMGRSHTAQGDRACRRCQPPDSRPGVHSTAASDVPGGALATGSAHHNPEDPVSP